MKVWAKPTIYVLIHILLGFFAFYYSDLIVAFLGYQLIQLFLDIRLFLFAWKIEQGNSLEHTLVKLGEFGFGYLIAFMWNKASNKV
jgi:hypothetical protein